MHDIEATEPTDLPTREEGLELEMVEDGPSEHGEHTIKLSTQVREKIYAPWKSSFIVKVVGKSFGYKALCTRLQGIWRPEGTFNMIDLGYEYFLVKFAQVSDYFAVLERCPWFVGDNYLSVRKWEPEFQATKAKVASLAEWIRLPELPIDFFQPDILQMIGRFVKIDTITNTVARAGLLAYVFS